MQPAKNTPRDFFLHTGAFVTLYFSAIALLTLLFGLINFRYRDEVFGPYYYQDPYSGPMRFAIASLIILVPITIYLFHIIQRDARAHAERRSLGVRKWLTYITLFIAGATVVGDLIILLNSFLGGALPTPFFLKVLAILLIVGAGFWYFFLDIKGYWMERATESRYVGMAVAFLVLISIVGGMLLIGSPAKQRDIRIDTEQINRLSYIQSGIVNYWQRTGELPASLADLATDFQRDPYATSVEGRPAFTYEKRGELTFALCATFAEQTPSLGYMQMEPVLGVSENWDHGVGMTCFERTIDPKLMANPLQKPVF